MHKYGSLCLIPTPLSDDIVLDNHALDLLSGAMNDLQNNKIYVEDLRPARRSWIRWGLDREVIDHFVLFNEHSMNGLVNKTIADLKAGKSIYLLSDGGLPAFCDPGYKLIRECHVNNIHVTSAPFNNSISLAIALSGIDVYEFHFFGFPPKKTEERQSFFQRVKDSDCPAVIMDTPYRLKKVLAEIQSVQIKRNLFLACNLNSNDEKLYFGKISSVIKKIEFDKAEFIIVIE